MLLEAPLTTGRAGLTDRNVVFEVQWDVNGKLNEPLAGKICASCKGMSSILVTMAPVEDAYNFFVFALAAFCFGLFF